MEHPENSDLFDVHINPEGKMYIRKLAVVVKGVFLVGFILSLLGIVEMIIRFTRVSSSYFKGGGLLGFQIRIYPVYILIYSVLFFMQLYYYRRASVLLVEGVDYSDDRRFNEAFNVLYRNAVAGIITLSLSLVMNLFDFYLIMKYY
jgi:hypothetical protein